MSICHELKGFYLFIFNLAMRNKRVFFLSSKLTVFTFVSAMLPLKKNRTVFLGAVIY